MNAVPATGPILSATAAPVASHATAAAAPGAGSGPLPSPPQVREAAQRAAAELKSVANALDFSVDAASGETVITVRDAATHSVVRTIPTPEILDIRRSIDRMQGILMRIKA